MSDDLIARLRDTAVIRAADINEAAELDRVKAAGDALADAVASNADSATKLYMALAAYREAVK